MNGMEWNGMEWNGMDRMDRNLVKMYIVFALKPMSKLVSTGLIFIFYANRCSLFPC